MVNGLHPGVLATDSFRDYPKYLMNVLNLFLENPQKGGERIAYLAESNDVKDVTEKYFYKSDEREIEIPPEESAKSEELWQITEELTGVEFITNNVKNSSL